MRLTPLLIAMTLVAVVGDAMLLPFYPQYFASRFGVVDASHVGSYIAAICLTAMLALPLWARWTRQRCPLRLLVWTQSAAGLLSAACALCDSLAGFWALSLGMIAFKASYLLIYPYIMENTSEADHAHTIGVLSIVVHFGSLVGALGGGAALQFGPVEHAFLYMAAGDFVQMAMCLVALRAGLTPAFRRTVPHAVPARDRRRVLRLGLLMLTFYFAEYQIGPFFIEYWRSVALQESALVSACVYAIPACIALIALAANRRAGPSGFLARPAYCLPMGIVGLLLQASFSVPLVLLGRCLFGWAAFQLTVRLDVQLFEHSAPEDYARDFSTINLFQNIGVLTASYAAGFLVERHGLHMPFWVAIAGFAATWALYPMLAPDRHATLLRTAEHHA